MLSGTSVDEIAIVTTDWCLLSPSPICTSTSSEHLSVTETAQTLDHDVAGDVVVAPAPNADFVRLGKSGDVISFDLKELAQGSGTQFSGLSFTTTGYGEFFLPETVGEEPFSSSGQFYVIPNPSFTGSISGTVVVDGSSRTFAVDVLSGYSYHGADIVHGDLSALNIMRLRQRLRYLGYPDPQGDLLKLDTGENDEFDANTRWALGLFMAAARGGVHNPQETTIHKALINSPQAPRWVELVGNAGITILDQEDGTSQTEKWGTDWTQSVLDRIGQALGDGGDRLGLRAASLRAGGASEFHQNEVPGAHHAGLSIDFETTATNSSAQPFFAVRTIGDERFVAAEGNRLIFYDAQSDSYYPGLDSGDLGQAVRVELPQQPDSPLSAWGNRPVLLGIRDLLLNNSVVQYDVDQLRRQITAILSVQQDEGPAVTRILNNDPRLWAERDADGNLTWTGNGISSLVQFSREGNSPGLNGILHVELMPPVRDTGITGGQLDVLQGGLLELKNALQAGDNLDELGVWLPLAGINLRDELQLGAVFQAGLVDLVDWIRVNDTTPTALELGSTQQLGDGSWQRLRVAHQWRWKRWAVENRAG